MLLAIGLGAAIVVAVGSGVLPLAAALVALLLTSLVVARASALHSFERTGRWRVRRGVLLGAAVVLLAAPPIGRFAAGPHGSERVARGDGPPDMVLIVLDTQRADHLGAYGDRRGLSPAFDAFAREATLFTDCFTSAPWTVPSHASLFTGLQPSTHGCSFEHHRWLDEKFTTLAEALAGRDYQTAAFAANPWLFRTNLTQGFATQVAVGARFAGLAIRPLLELLGWPARYADHGAADAVEQVDAWLARRNGERPLFLFVNLLEPHWRYLPPIVPRLEQTSPDPGALVASELSTRFYGPLAMAGRMPAGPVEPSIRALYAAAVEYQDEKLGELLAVLRERLDLEHTIVAITADHGENLGEGGRWDHVFALNDALVHVPLAIRYPPAFPAGTRIDGLCQLVDVPVTLFSFTARGGDAKLGDDLAGRSLVPTRFEPREIALLFGDPFLGHLERMSAATGFNRDVARFAGVLRGARSAHHKLVRSNLGSEQLIDLAADPDEVKDASASEPGVRDALRAQLDAGLQALPGSLGPAAAPALGSSRRARRRTRPAARRDRLRRRAAMSELRRGVLVALTFGLACGIVEGIGLYVAQEQGWSRWPILLSSGREILWVSPLVDAALFVVLGIAIVALARLCRLAALPLVAAACCGVLAYDWTRITAVAPRRIALLAMAATAAVAWLLLRRRERGLARVGLVGAPLLGLLAAAIAIREEVVAPIEEARAEARLPPPPKDARDVIVVVLDTVRSDHLSAYGYARRTTPELERLAAEGARFDDCFSTSAWTLPAHASMLTGRLPWEHGAALEPLDATWPVLGEEMLAHGWRTGAFSGNLCFFVRHYGFGRGFLEFDDFGWSWPSRLGVTLAARELLTILPARIRETRLRKPAHAVVDSFPRWLDRSPDRPAFAFLNFFDAHDPYRPPAPERGRFHGDGIAPPPMPPPGPDEDRPWTDASMAHESELYDECLLVLDREIGRLRSELERRGRLHRAILVVLADHGEAFGERGARLHRCSPHREQTQVPLIVRAPGIVPPGTVCEEVASLASLPATLLDMLGLESGHFPGPSLAPAWRGGDDDDDPVAVIELARHPWVEYRRRPCYDGAMRSLVRGRWQYVWHEKHGGQLFDRVADPREEHDLAAEHQDIAAALDQQLRSELAERRRHPNEPSGVDLSSRPDLAGIGYVDDGGAAPGH